MATPERVIERTPAVEWLEYVRRCSARIAVLGPEIKGLEHAWKNMLPWQVSGSGGGSANVHSDPTATSAFARIEGLEKMLAEKTEEFERSSDVVAECGLMLHDMSCVLGARYARVLELYYIDLAETWTDVAYEMGKHRDTIRAWRKEAIAWINANSARYLL